MLKNLSGSYRGINTSTQNFLQVMQGRLKGRIDWQGTYQVRYIRNYQDKTIFSCIQRNKNFNNKENLVLKNLLEVINKILTEDIDLNKKYQWIKDWSNKGRLYQEFNDIYHKNIYINRVDTSGVKITGRMINDTKKSRNKLYRKAAELLNFYRELTKPAYWQDEEIIKEIKNLLKETFIRPESENVLFELYWVFKLLRKHEGAKYRIIDGSNNLVASWEDDKDKLIYNLYHDSEGSSQLKFKIDLSELKNSENDI